MRARLQSTNRRALLLVPLLLVLLNGCHPFRMPSTVVRSLYEDCNRGEYQKARVLFSSDLRIVVDADPTPNFGATRAICDRLTRSGSMTGIDIASENIRGDEATVAATIHFGDNSSPGSTHLIKEDGAWKLRK